MLVRSLARYVRGVTYSIVVGISPPPVKIRFYRSMQRKRYRSLTKTAWSADEACVGHYEAHQNYPYKRYLLEQWSPSKGGQALDFGCGPGRMMAQMINEFDVLDGIDLDPNNLAWAAQRLRNEGISGDKFNLYLSSGVHCGPLPVDNRYDFIYSTIALQHISAYSIRKQIFLDMFELLKDGGQACLQVGFGWDGPSGWFEDRFDALSTNGGFDACIADEHQLQAVIEDFNQIGFNSVIAVKRPSPHPERDFDYHPVWLFLYLTK